MTGSNWQCNGIPHPKNKKQYTWTGSHTDSPVEVSGAICPHCGLPHEAILPNTITWMDFMRKNKRIVALIAAGSLIVPVGIFLLGREGIIIPKSSRFSCVLGSDPNGSNPRNPEGKDVFTVTYRNDKDKEARPWLFLVRSFGGGFDPARRCEEIASRLEQLRQDGLLSLKYREDPNTPKQNVICAVTKQSGDSCPLLITLGIEDDPEESLKQIAGGLIEGRGGSYQGTHGEGISSPGQISHFSIDLTGHLSEEDKKAGE